MSFEPQAPYLFVVDTTDYAGNFERDMCAYITGRVGRCGVGEDYAAAFAEETKLEPFENVIEESDDHGCLRPATMYGPKHRSVAISFGSKPAKAQVELMRQRAVLFAEKPDEWAPERPRVKKVVCFRLIRQELLQTEIEVW